MKKTAAILLVFVLCLSLGACSSQPIQGEGFDEPEEAILAYANALKETDTEAILRTFAVESFVENYDPEAYLEMTQVYMPGTLYLENCDNFTKELNLQRRETKILRSVANSYGSCLLADDMEDVTVMIAEMEISDDFVEPEDINELYAEYLEERFDNLCDIYGCDEMASLALEVELDGDDYLLCMDLACYDGKWYNLQQDGQMAVVLGMPAGIGGIIPADQLDN